MYALHQKAPNILNAFTPKFKKYILLTFWREMYKLGGENW